MQVKIQGSRDIPILQSWANALIEGAVHQRRTDIQGKALRSFFRAMPVVYVNMYLDGRAYGGPEEGGWYFNHGTPADEWVSEPIYCEEVWGPSITSFGLPEEEQMETIVKDLHHYFETVYTEIGRAEIWAIENNKGRPDIGSVLSEGRFRVQVEHDEARAYPEHTPHYQ